MPAGRCTHWWRTSFPGLLLATSSLRPNSVSPASCGLPPASWASSISPPGCTPVGAADSPHPRPNAGGANLRAPCMIKGRTDRAIDMQSGHEAYLCREHRNRALGNAAACRTAGAKAADWGATILAIVLQCMSQG